MNEKKLVMGVIIVSAVILFGGAFVSSSISKEVFVEENGQVTVSVENTMHDWGEIDIDAGTVDHAFTITNNGTGDLKLHTVKTSCMCTIAYLKYKNETSPEFGMHSKSNFILSIPPGESAELMVIFDPAFHGPNGIGPITRQILVDTNDPENSTLTFSLNAKVVK